MDKEKLEEIMESPEVVAFSDLVRERLKSCEKAEEVSAELVELKNT